MNSLNEKIKDSCPRTEIAAYLDGEFSPSEELRIESHFAVCAACQTELNLQKNLLRALDDLVGEKKFELPENFTKTVVINAESSVQGLRCPKERLRALIVCAVLFVLILAGLGNETEAVLSTIGTFFEQVWTVGVFTAHLIYDITVALTTILRLIGSQFIFNSAFAFFAWGAFLTAFLLMLSRYRLRASRSKI